MTKIRISERQYNLILSHKNLIKEGDDVITTDSDVLLLMNKFINEKSATGFNEYKLDKLLTKENIGSVLEKTKTILEDKQKLEELIQDLKNGKGVVDPEKKMVENLSHIIAEFNKLSKENNLDVKLSREAMNNINSLKSQ
jgi:hypothetical protein